MCRLGGGHGVMMDRQQQQQLAAAGVRFDHGREVSSEESGQQRVRFEGQVYKEQIRLDHIGPN